MFFVLSNHAVDIVLDTPSRNQVEHARCQSRGARLHAIGVLIDDDACSHCADFKREGRRVVRVTNLSEEIRDNILIEWRVGVDNDVLRGLREFRASIPVA